MKKEEYRQKKQNNKITMKKHRVIVERHQGITFIQVYYRYVFF